MTNIPNGDGDLLSASEMERDLANTDHRMNAELGSRRDPVAELPLVTVLPNADVAVSRVAAPHASCKLA